MLTDEQKEKLKEIREKIRAFVFERVKREDAVYVLSIIDSLTLRVKELEGERDKAIQEFEQVKFIHDKNKALQSRLDKVEEAAGPIINSIPKEQREIWIRYKHSPCLGDNNYVNARIGDLRKLSEVVRGKVLKRGQGKNSTGRKENNV